MTDAFKLSSCPIPLDNIYTAAQAQTQYMLDHIPFGARVFVMSGVDACSKWQDLLERSPSSELVPPA